MFRFATFFVLLASTVALADRSASAASVYAHYSFDNGYNDVSGNLRHGTLTDVGTIGNSGITSTPGEFKFGGGGLNLSSEADYVAIPSKTFGSGVPYSIAFWAKKAQDNKQWDMVIGDRNNNVFFIALNDTSGSLTGIRWRSNTSASGNREVDAVAPNDTNWHHYVIVADGSDLTVYVDKIAAAGSETGVSTGFTLNTIGQAYTTASFSFFGQIDEMWIFDSAIDQTIINNLYQYNSLVAPEPGTYGLFAVGFVGLALLAWRRRRTAALANH